MRTLPLLSAALLSFAPHLVAQNPPVDMSLWTIEDINGSGPWTIDPARQFAYHTNTVNTDVSTFYSDFDVVFLEFRMRIDAAGGDDDLPGFILGWQPGDATSTTADYVLVDWKRLTQNYQDWGTANIGLALSHVQGQLTRGFGNAPIDLWSHTLNCTELARSVNFGSTGWAFDTDYAFRVIYTPTQVDIWLDGQHEFSVAGNFRPGRFACYDFSQSRTGFYFPAPGAVSNFGAGCAGTAGTPYLFSPVTPYIGERLPVIVADVPTNGLAFFAIGLSNQVWNGIPLPLPLVSLGAPSCTAYVSGDAFLPVGNYNGTLFQYIDIPPTIGVAATPLFHVQALALDLPANGLGIVFSNAASVTPGLR